MTASAPVTPTLPAANERRRLDSLTGLRWWAAFAVFVFHMKNLAPLPVDDVLRLGNSGVAFFFILSGFVLTWSARPGVSPLTFWWRRFARIWPAHMVALLLAIPVFYSLTPDATASWVKPVSVGVLLLSVVLLQGWSLNPAILFSGHPAAWTLTCEAFFYALHPSINRFVKALAGRGALAAGAIVIGLLFAYRLAVIAWPAGALAQLPTPMARLGEFVLGMLIARVMRSGWRLSLNPVWIFAIGGAILLALGFAPRWADLHPLIPLVLSYTNEITIVVFACVIAGAASRDLSDGRSILRTRVMVALGDLSYAFYLVHATVIYAFLRVVEVRHDGWGNLAWYAVAAAISIAVAAALHYGVERPLELRMRAWWDARLLARTTSRKN